MPLQLGTKIIISWNRSSKEGKRGSKEGKRGSKEETRVSKEGKRDSKEGRFVLYCVPVYIT